MKPMSDKAMFTIPERLKLKTYSHLSSKKKIPSEYELTTSNMLYYIEKGGFEVQTPISGWYETYQKNVMLVEPQWDQFMDPMQTTYAVYVQRQKNEELFLDTHAKHQAELGHDALLDKEWIQTLSQLLAPLRYPWHGVQMISSYLGSMAPEGKLVMTFAFQTMDDMRRIQRVAYRMRQLQMVDASFGEDSLSAWQHAPQWQPLRRCIEHLLITYNWLESFIALNLCLKPILDQLLLIEFATMAKNRGDSQLAMMFHSFWGDTCWQQAWSRSLLELMLQADPENKIVIQERLMHWLELVVPAVLALRPLFLDKFDLICERLFRTYVERLKEINLQVTLTW